MAKDKDKEDEGPPGAGTLFVYHGGSATLDWAKLPETQPRLLPSPDVLLDRGIADYTYVPRTEGGVLGRGKFSTVYRVRAGSKEFALKHTPLYPHHPLIAARLLREPTLLAQLSPHPCLIGVDGFVRTDGHFYLVEECARTHVPLPHHPLPLAPSRAAYILDQLISVVRDDLHAGRVCHRDLKGDNVLIDIETGNILLLDLGLGTNFSASEPKLTTCCGSPAFHSPEIVNALNHRPGEVTYYGPEVDIWCIALTMLAMLLQTRFPLGPHHKSRTIMAERANECLDLMDAIYPPGEPWRALGPGVVTQLTDIELVEEELAWTRVRRAMYNFVDIDAHRRMKAFAKYDVGQYMRARITDHARMVAFRTFKTTTFVPSEVKHTLPLYLEMEDDGPIVFRNPSHESEKRIVSYIKYLLRCAGILYHHVPDTNPPVLQLVLPLAPPAEEPDKRLPQTEGWMAQLLGLGRKSPFRSNSVPPPTVRKEAPPLQADLRGKRAWAQQAWMQIEVEKVGNLSGSRQPSRAPSRAPSRPTSRPTSRPGSRNPSKSGRPGSRSRALSTPEEPLSPATEHTTLEPLQEGKPHQHLMRHLVSLTAERNADKKPVPRRTVSTPLIEDPPSPPLSPHVQFGAPLRRTVSVSIAALAHAPRVVLTLSEPRGYPVVREALATAVPPPLEGSRRRGPEVPPTPPTRALAIPNAGGDDDEEPSRGRSRSKETPPNHLRDDRERSSTVKPNTGKGRPLIIDTSGHNTPRPSKPRRHSKDRERTHNGDKWRATSDSGHSRSSVQSRGESAHSTRRGDSSHSRMGESNTSRRSNPGESGSMLILNVGKAGAAAAIASRPVARRSSSVPPLLPVTPIKGLGMTNRDS
ncbi:hypothetical protein CcaverHIS002_0607000 [Cutaneotrichosporon cavernicola]|uniref:Protein kinase domain-containing protein n=1 Tax=Cutaneotrichosporon cavernicola TaxID=279322 RepID=A0AA48L981_9TREE|nr:uncharacterized protein CcaverHIS019_0606420 [Cutaneotrichosporon cavernicola]BEI86413.1 hypothetical protein CcaverHIS002_0607000 [Cutaneotrichosporon cavernicola]BEI94183.1 hypothetical protein CcaverHIS019_0606420 [Cutaneotrichosporon cavernicola]BEJ01963.1 hypothetical protein CcaverHIS631_0606450 [Cutaneotrichosporon cavernicola]BEJ09727.1 hypothetical protein CcaverHIS641_0606420 [Cutaneotrichosporon cavernicola]